MAIQKTPTTTPTSAPATDQSATYSQTQTGNTQNQEVLNEKKRAINEVFALFKLNYHNQFSAAFPDTETLHHAKRLWLEALAAFAPQDIMLGAKRAILQSEYLPTVHKMLKLCAAGENGLPEARAAYREACNAPSPKTNFHWSHLAVYHAGRESNWFFLANNPESTAYPVFAEHYRKICERVLKGEQLTAPEQLKLEESPSTPLSKEENTRRLAELRAQLGI
ncbi:replication protein P [Microbulbifer sp. OS29]|uniref:Replication protein P n=1 Tax=Microbulbifer okhotskensis TaxID=2926617 RepID=A0A9X2EN95_9GAMM|nr:replication protein P [Microbulbifer okhotskensis]MCO1334735.1 replication protein P [Microbulbifer okhotskensis]